MPALAPERRRLVWDEAADLALLRLLYRKEKLLLEGSSKSLREARMLSQELTHAALRRKASGADLSSWSPERLILLITHACQLRCGYCRVSKFSENMSVETMRRGVDLLMTSRRPAIQLQFFGGDPLLKFDLIRKAVDRTEALRQKNGKTVHYMLTTNGHALNAGKLAFFKPLDFLIEFSFDGDRGTFQEQRPGVGGRDFYDLIVANLEALRDSGVRYYVICVVTPDSVDRVYDNVMHIAGLGHRRIQVNYQLGRYWPQESVKKLLVQMGRIARQSKLRGFEFVNTTEVRREPTVLNSELVVDVDGEIYRETGICLEEDFQRQKRDFRVVGVEDAHSLEDYPASPFDNFRLLSGIYGRRSEGFRRIILNNIETGYALDRWVRSAA